LPGRRDHNKQRPERDQEEGRNLSRPSLCVVLKQKKKKKTFGGNRSHQPAREGIIGWDARHSGDVMVSWGAGTLAGMKCKWCAEGLAQKKRKSGHYRRAGGGAVVNDPLTSSGTSSGQYALGGREGRAIPHQQSESQFSGGERDVCSEHRVERGGGTYTMILETTYRTKRNKEGKKKRKTNRENCALKVLIRNQKATRRKQKGHQQPTVKRTRTENIGIRERRVSTRPRRSGSAEEGSSGAVRVKGGGGKLWLFGGNGDFCTSEKGYARFPGSDKKGGKKTAK